MDLILPSFEMLGAVGCVLLLVPSEGILTDETDTGTLLTLDTDTGRFDVIPDGKLFLIHYHFIFHVLVNKGDLRGVYWLKKELLSFFPDNLLYL